MTPNGRLSQVQASPYKEMSDDFLASASSFGLVAVFLCSYAFKDFELVGLQDIYVHMSREQRNLYILNQTTLTLIMLTSVIGILLLSFLVFIVQLTIEGRRLRQEARASKARRLRLKANNEEVHPSQIAPGHYHLFLSHVWGTGQDQMRSAGMALKPTAATPLACLLPSRCCAHHNAIHWQLPSNASLKVPLPNMAPPP